MELKKTLMIVFIDMKLGGIQVKIIDLIKYLNWKKPEIKIILCLRRREGFMLNRLPKTVTVLSPNSEESRWKKNFFPFWLAAKFRKYKPERVLSFDDYASISSVIAKIIGRPKTKIIISEDILTSKFINSQKHQRLRILLIRFLYPMAERIITLSDAGKNDLSKLMWSSKKIVISRNWMPLINTKKYDKHKLKRNIDILYLGRIESQKNIKYFIDIIKILVIQGLNLKVSIVGEGTELENIKQYCFKKGLNQIINFEPATNYPEKFYLRSKIFLLTSDYEGFPLTIIEALFYRCGVVMRDINEVNDYFDSYRDNIFYKNKLESSQKIKQILANNKLRKDITQYYSKKIRSEQMVNLKKMVGLIIS